MLRAIPGLNEIGKVVRGNRHLLLCGIKLELNCICQRLIIFHGIAGIVAVEPLFLENIGTSVLVTPSQVIQFLRIISCFSVEYLRRKIQLSNLFFFHMEWLIWYKGFSPCFLAEDYAIQHSFSGPLNLLQTYEFLRRNIQLSNFFFLHMEWLIW